MGKRYILNAACEFKKVIKLLISDHVTEQKTTSAHHIGSIYNVYYTLCMLYVYYV